MTTGVFFNSFQKGPVVCRGVNLDLSGKLAKKPTLTWKKGRHAYNVFPLAIAMYEICHRARLTLLPLCIQK